MIKDFQGKRSVVHMVFAFIIGVVLTWLIIAMVKGADWLGKNYKGGAQDDAHWYKDGVCAAELDRFRTMYEMKLLGTKCMSPYNHIDSMTITDSGFHLTISNSKLNESMTLSASETGRLQNQMKDVFEQWKDREKEING